MKPLHTPAQETLTPLPSPLTSWGEIPPDHVQTSAGLHAWQSVRIPNRLRLAARWAMGLFVLFMIMVVFVPWTQTVTAQGQLSAYSPLERPQSIHAPIAGRIGAWHVNEGMQVSKGDLILELIDVDPEFMAPDLLARLDQSQQALEQQRQAAMERAELLKQAIQEMSALVTASVSSADARVEERDNFIGRAKERLVAAKIAKETADLNLKRNRLLEAEGLVSRRELELAIRAATRTRAELNAAQAALREAEQGRRALDHGRDRIRAELEQRLLATRAQRASALEDAARATNDLAVLALKRSNAEHRRAASRVLAPSDGTIVKMARVGTGEIVHPGDLLVHITPASATRAVEMWVEALDAPLLAPGRRVKLLFHGIPTIPLSAWPELMAGTFDGIVQVVDQVGDQDGRFRFWVGPDPNGRPWPPQDHVRQGTQVMGWVILSRVPLWYEIWRRLNLLPPDYQSVAPVLMDLVLPKAGRPVK